MSKKKETKLSKYMKVPLKMMVKARDLYIKSMNQLSSHDFPGGGMAFGIPVAHQVSGLPRSFSTSYMPNSARQKERCMDELVRSASARTRSVSRISEKFESKPAKDVTIATQRGPWKLRKAKSLRSGGGNDDHRFEKIDEASPLINFGSNKKMMLQRSKTYNVVKQIGSSEFQFKNT